MIDIEKKIAEHTLKKLHKKSWNTLTLDDVIEKKNKKQKFKTNVRRQCANERSGDQGQSSNGSITQSTGAELGV